MLVRSVKSRQFFQRSLEIREPLLAELLLPIRFNLAHGGDVGLDNQPAPLGEVNGGVTVGLLVAALQIAKPSS